MALITGTNFSWPNLTASNICFSVRPEVSDSTIKTASFVPATTKSNLDSFNCSFEGFKTYWSFIYPTLEAAIGPWKGIPEIAKAADDAIIDNISASFSLSYERTVGKICTSFLKLSGNKGLIGLSINLEINVSASVGLASLLK